ncbi:pentraxin fusion protein-like [Crassostrea angulata]|uniref:pentraxin fusion protein-like n=1 Tax=Magallana angulata TaxID=2784310 RepID=UPI0022B0F154|nr:pentraxin fusion protein-like [Crassostrea angulata]
MSLLLFIALLLHVNVTLGHEELRNVAYSKKVTLSSENSLYPGSNAVNGILTDFAHTAPEKHPWLIIDLGATYEVHEIEVFARSGCCGNQIHDLDVRVGSDPRNMKLCGHFTGHASNGQRIAFWCPYNTKGQYVKLQIMAEQVNRLSPAEVLVWGLQVY